MLLQRGMLLPWRKKLSEDVPETDKNGQNIECIEEEILHQRWFKFTRLKCCSVAEIHESTRGDLFLLVVC